MHVADFKQTYVPTTFRGTVQGPFDFYVGAIAMDSSYRFKQIWCILDAKPANPTDSYQSLEFWYGQLLGFSSQALTGVNKYQPNIMGTKLFEIPLEIFTLASIASFNSPVFSRIASVTNAGQNYPMGQFYSFYSSSSSGVMCGAKTLEVETEANIMAVRIRAGSCQCRSSLMLSVIGSSHPSRPYLRNQFITAP